MGGLPASVRGHACPPISESAFPPARRVHTICDHFSLCNADAAAAFLESSRYGIAAPDLAKSIVAGADYSQGHAMTSIVKAPSINGSR